MGEDLQEEFVNHTMDPDYDYDPEDLVDGYEVQRPQDEVVNSLEPPSTTQIQLNFLDLSEDEELAWHEIEIPEDAHLTYPLMQEMAATEAEVPVDWRYWEHDENTIPPVDESTAPPLAPGWVDPVTNTVIEGHQFQFTGLADGSPWPAFWQVSASTAGGTAVVEAEHGKVITGSTGNWSDTVTVAATEPDTPQVGAVLTVWKTGGQDITPHLVWTNTAGRYVEIKLAGGGIEVYDSASGGAKVGDTIPAGPWTTPRRIRTEIDGATLRIRYWTASDPEPTTWNTFTLGDAGGTNEEFRIFAVGGGAATSTHFFVDDIEIGGL